MALGLSALAVGVDDAAGAAPRTATTLTVALPPGSVPTSVFPFETGAQCTATNFSYWSLEVRPGYWVGLGKSVALIPSLSPLTVPTFTTTGPDTTVTLTTKGWTWSNGAGGTQTMTAQDVALFLNIDRAQSKQGVFADCGDTPGFGIPDQVLSVTYPDGLSGDAVSIVFQGHDDPLWLEYNELSQIVPLAQAWDTTGTGDAGCASEAFASVRTDGTDVCSAVFTHLSGLRVNDPLWSWSDGPYRQQSAQLASGQPDGHDVQVANAQYSGPVKPQAARSIVYTPFAQMSSEISALEQGKADVGTADPSDLSRAPGPGRVGHNLLAKLSNFEPLPSDLFAVFYWEFNFDNAHSTYETSGPLPTWARLVNQQYFRAAMQESENQGYVITHTENGMGVPTTSAIPTLPSTPYDAGVKDPYPYSPTAGKALMRAHGWNTRVFPDECAAANCGTAADPIPRGSRAEITLLVANGGNPATAAQTRDEATFIKKAAGIEMRLEFEGPGTVMVTPCYELTGWEMCSLGGWIYTPDFYPSGELLFTAGAVTDPGGYDSAEMNHLVAETTTAGSLALDGRDATYHTSYAQWSATDVPFLWQPVPVGCVEQLKSITGAEPPNPLGDFNPEYITSI